MRKIRGKDERLVADDADRKGQGELVAFDSDKNPSLIDVPPDVVRDRFLVAQFHKAPARIILHMAIPGALEAFDAVDEPARARFHETEAHLGIFIEHAVEQNPAEIHHLSEWMAERVHRRIRRHIIEAHVIVHAAVNADAALQAIGFLVNWPITYVTDIDLPPQHPRA